MLRAVADGVFVHESEFLQSNAVIVEGTAGVLLVDPGLTAGELAGLADELRVGGMPVVAGFSTHWHWDHVLWHAGFGDAPRYATSRCAELLQGLLAQRDWREQIAEGLPPEYADEIPMALLGQVMGLPAGAAVVPWDGPTVRILEHRGHSDGHAALLIEDARVLVAGDMLSDTLIPFLDLQAANPIEDYLAALRLLQSVVDQADAVVPGHGSVGRSGDLATRIAADRAYVEALRDGGLVDDARIGPSAPLDWMVDVHEGQVHALAGRRSAD